MHFRQILCQRQSDSHTAFMRVVAFVILDERLEDLVPVFYWNYSTIVFKSDDDHFMIFPVEMYPDLRFCIFDCIQYQVVEYLVKCGDIYRYDGMVQTGCEFKPQVVVSYSVREVEQDRVELLYYVDILAFKGESHLFNSDIIK